jgi:hypothetical protein
MLFESSDLPFYKFGAVHYLKKIKLEEWVPFIAAKFKKSGKSISGKDVEPFAWRWIATPTIHSMHFKSSGVFPIPK